jgi:hypothetical protein
MATQDTVEEKPAKQRSLQSKAADPMKAGMEHSMN